jgi:nicotinate-nucleotide adenylyltransferase
MRLGLLGGSFNPIHHGHLITAVRAAEAARLDRVLFIPASVSPLKGGRSLASARDRWTMLKAALRGNPLFEASDLELRRGGVSYTVDTLRELRRSRPKARLYWILGTDAAAQLHRWKSPDEVRLLAELVVIARPGARVPRTVPRASVVRAPLLDISSSEIRDRIRRGLSVRYMVPDAVERQIRRKGLYRG